MKKVTFSLMVMALMAALATSVAAPVSAIVIDPGCSYEICLTDDYGDGWNGGYVDVYVNGFLVYSLTLSSGWGPECYPIPINTGDEITVYFSGGGWPYECEYRIYDWDGNLVRAEGTGGVNPGNVLPGELYGICDECEPSIDIKPGSDPNSINLNSKGVIPVAILTTECFNAAMVTPDTILFAGAAPVRWAFEDVDGDGDMDMILHFKTQETDIMPGDTEATLTGVTEFGVSFMATDSVMTVPPST